MNEIRHTEQDKDEPIAEHTAKIPVFSGHPVEAKKELLRDGGRGLEDASVTIITSYPEATMEYAVHIEDVESGERYTEVVSVENGMIYDMTPGSRARDKATGKVEAKTGGELSIEKCEFIVAYEYS